jgi:hypothetical protein
MISRVPASSILIRTHTTHSRRSLRLLLWGVPPAQQVQQGPQVEAVAVEVAEEAEAALRAQAQAQARVPLPPR